MFPKVTITPIGYFECKSLLFVEEDKTIQTFLSIWKKYAQTFVNVTELTDDGTNVVLMYDDTKELSEFSDESYSITITENRIEITASNQYGIMHGLKTLLFLFDGNKLPLITNVQDTPKSNWRGLLLDPARHFIPVCKVMTILKVMCLLKLNVLHLHLSDDQGFCYESKFAGEHYYTKEELQFICEFAAELGIRVVPEIDIPGHVSQIILKDPKMGMNTKPEQTEKRNCLLRPVLNVLDEYVIDELAQLFQDMTTIFKDKYFHIGGDEVDYSDWKEDPKTVEYMKEKGYASDFKLLQIDFTKRICEKALKGKKIVAWDELYHKDLHKFFDRDTLVIQRWRNSTRVLSITKDFDLINSQGYYLNRLFPAQWYYSTRTPDTTKVNRVSGGEACLWGNMLCDENTMSTLFPSLCPVAEQLWGPTIITKETIDDMYARLDQFNSLLTQFEPTLDHRNATLKLPELCNYLESIWGGFTEGHPRNSLKRLTGTPMTHLEDFVLPESRHSRYFYEKVVKFITTNTQDFKGSISAELCHIKSLCDQYPLDKRVPNGSTLPSVVMLLCDIGIDALEHKASKHALEFVEQAETTYYDNMHIAICSAIKLLVLFALDNTVTVPEVMPKLNKTKIGGIFLAMKLEKQRHKKK